MTTKNCYKARPTIIMYKFRDNSLAVRNLLPIAQKRPLDFKGKSPKIEQGRRLRQDLDSPLPTLTRLGLDLG